MAIICQCSNFPFFCIPKYPPAINAKMPTININRNISLFLFLHLFYFFIFPDWRDQNNTSQSPATAKKIIHQKRMLFFFAYFNMTTFILPPHAKRMSEYVIDNLLFFLHSSLYYREYFTPNLYISQYSVHNYTTFVIICYFYQ